MVTNKLSWVSQQKLSVNGTVIHWTFNGKKWSKGLVPEILGGEILGLLFIQITSVKLTQLCGMGWDHTRVSMQG